MNNEKDILSKINRRSGMTTPQGYFDDFAAKMMERLPEHPTILDQLEKRKPTIWFRIRPYVYMAAMFAGIWCMLNIFNLTGGIDNEFKFEDNSVVAKALSDDEFVDQYFYYDIDDAELMEEMYRSGMQWDESASDSTAMTTLDNQPESNVE